MALRVARGLFRMWLVLSVLWIGGVGYVTWKGFPDDWVSVCEQGEAPPASNCLPPGFVLTARCARSPSAGRQTHTPCQMDYHDDHDDYDDHAHHHHPRTNHR